MSRVGTIGTYRQSHIESHYQIFGIKKTTFIFSHLLLQILLIPQYSFQQNAMSVSPIGAASYKLPRLCMEKKSTYAEGLKPNSVAGRDHRAGALHPEAI